jgi:ZU5 domain
MSAPILTPSNKPVRSSLRGPLGAWLAAAAVVSLSCGSPAPGGQPVTQQVVGPAGGQVTANGGRVKLTIPPNALKTNVPITIGQVSSPASGALGPVYEIGPTGQTFAQPVVISLVFASADLKGAAASTLHVATLSKGAWVPITSSVSFATNSVAGQITHLSPWTIISYDKVVPPEPPVGGTGGGNDDGAAGAAGGSEPDASVAGSDGAAGATGGADGGAGTDGAAGKDGGAGAGGTGGAGGKAGSGGAGGKAGAGGAGGKAGSGGSGGGATGGAGASGGAGATGAAGSTGVAGAGGQGGSGSAGAGGTGGFDAAAGAGGAGASGTGGDDAGVDDAADDASPDA